MVTNRDAGHEVDQRDTGAPRTLLMVALPAALRTMTAIRCQGMPSTRCRRRRWSATQVASWAVVRKTHRNVAPTVVSTRMPLGHTGPVPMWPTTRAAASCTVSGSRCLRDPGQLRGPCQPEVIRCGSAPRKVWVATSGSPAERGRRPRRKGADEVGSWREPLRRPTITKCRSARTDRASPASDAARWPPEPSNHAGSRAPGDPRGSDAVVVPSTWAAATHSGRP